MLLITASVAAGLFSPSAASAAIPQVFTKTATPTYDRKYTWQIDKSAASTSLTLSKGQVYSMDYTVDVNASSADSGHAIGGTITVFNPAPVAATVTGVSDSFAGLPITVNCPVSFPTSLASGASLVCTYSKALGGVMNGTNTATATTTGEVGSGTGTAAVTFGAPSSVTDECITINDNRYGSLGQVCANASPFSKKLSYAFSIGPYDTCGPASFENTASFATNDTNATGSDSVTVNSNVTILNTHTHPSGMCPTGTPAGAMSSPAAVGEMKATKVRAK
jgi:hypothetical protein